MLYYIDITTLLLSPSLIIVYGVDLTTLLKVYSTKIPIVVKHCIEELERRGKEREREREGEGEREREREKERDRERERGREREENILLLCFFVFKGLGIDGLYRIPGKAMEILEIKKQFDSGR